MMVGFARSTESILLGTLRRRLTTRPLAVDVGGPWTLPVMLDDMRVAMDDASSTRLTGATDSGSITSDLRVFKQGLS